MTKRKESTLVARMGTPRRFLEWAAMIQTDDCIVWPFAKTGKGYGAVYINGRTLQAHRQVLILATGHVPTLSEDCRHGPCHDRACVNPRHLSWGSRSDNALDKRRDGTALEGESHGMSRLTTDDVAEIRRRAASGERRRHIAADFGVTREHVNAIVRRKVWK